MFKMKNYAVVRGKKWQIGDVTIESIFEVERLYPFKKAFKRIFQKASLLPDELGWLIPDFANENFDMKLLCQSYLIKSQGKNILVETGMNAPGPYEENLRAAGCRPQDIDYVIFSHLHYDHIGRNTKMGINGTLKPTFVNARYLFGREQYNHFKLMYEDPEERKNDSFAYEHRYPYLLHIRPLVEMGMVDFMDDDFNLHGVISLFPAPGHTPGHYAIVVESKGASAFIGGDVVHHPLQMTQTDVAAAFDYDPVLASQTREKICEKLAGTDTLYLGMHFAENPGGFVIKADKCYKLVNG